MKNIQSFFIAGKKLLKSNGKIKSADILARIVKNLQPWISQNYLALQRQKDHLYIAHARKGFWGYELIALHCYHLPKHNQDTQVNTENKTEIPQLLIKQFSDITCLVLLLDQEYTILREIQVPNLENRDLQLVIPLAIENLLKMPIEEIEVTGHGRHLPEKEGTTIQVITFTAQHKDLRQVASHYRDRQHSIKLITCDSVALAMYLKCLKKPISYKNILQVHVDLKSININLIHDNLLRFSRVIPMIEYNETFILQEIKRTILGATDALPDFEIVYLSSVSSPKDHLKKIIHSFVKKPVCFYEHRYSYNGNMDAWIKVIGLSYHYTLPKNDQLNFLSNKLSRSVQGTVVHHWRLFRNPLIATASFITIFFISLFFQAIAENIQIHNYQSKIRSLANKMPFLQDAKGVDDIINRLQLICLQRSSGIDQNANVINIIHNVNRFIPEKDKVFLEFNRLRYQDNGLELTIIVKNITQANELENSLKNNQQFDSFELIERKLIPPQQKVQLRLLLKAKVSGNNYATDCQIL